MSENIVKINEYTPEPAINIVLDTIKKDKQCIVFVNTKKSAESLAEKISLKLKKDKILSDDILLKLSKTSQDILNAVSSPTKQCHRLSEISKHAVAFHHSGLVAAQRDIIEQDFKDRTIKVIVATPTLAMGVDLPAFRVVIKDLKRFGVWGMQYIPVLEYEQQAGRAGRPSYDSHGEAVCIADTENARSEIEKRYINGEPEDIYSKLAVEPIMRTYILSLISSEFVNTTYQLEEFFSETFYAYQYQDPRKLRMIINKMLDMLAGWGFIVVEEGNEQDSVKSKDTDFVSAFKYAFGDKYATERRIKATLLGKRVSELYLDPYTANELITKLRIAFDKKIAENTFNELSIVQAVCSSLELRPLVKVKTGDVDKVETYLNMNSDFILGEVPEMFDDDYSEFLDSIKTSMFFLEWMSEKDEEYIMEHYDVRPGELNAKKDRADWLLYAMEELSRLLKMHSIVKHIAKIRVRIDYGVKEELLPLLQLKNIGRVRARAMFNNKIYDISDVKKVDITTLSQILGKNVALDVKKQVGQELDPSKVQVKENKRKGQINLNDYG